MNTLSFLLTLSSSILASEAALRGSQPVLSQEQRALSTDGTGFQGACTVDNFTDLVGRATLENLLGVGTNTDTIQVELTARCTAALDPEM